MKYFHRIFVACKSSRSFLILKTFVVSILFAINCVDDLIQQRNEEEEKIEPNCQSLLAFISVNQKFNCREFIENIRFMVWYPPDDVCLIGIAFSYLCIVFRQVASFHIPFHCNNISTLCLTDYFDLNSRKRFSYPDAYQYLSNYFGTNWAPIKCRRILYQSSIA